MELGLLLFIFTTGPGLDPCAHDTSQTVLRIQQSPSERSLSPDDQQFIDTLKGYQSTSSQKNGCALLQRGRLERNSALIQQSAKAFPERVRPAILSEALKVALDSESPSQRSHALIHESIETLLARHQSISKAEASLYTASLRRKKPVAKPTMEKRPLHSKKEKRHLLLNAPHTKHARQIEHQILDGTIQLSQRDQTTRINSLVGFSRLERAALEAHALNKRPNELSHAPLMVAMSKAWVRGEEATVALNFIDQMLIRYPHNELLRENKGWVLGKLDRQEEAASEFFALAKATTNRQRAAKSCFFAGFYFYETNQYDSALQYFSSCEPYLRESDWLESALWYKALILIITGKTQNAVTTLTRLVEKFPSSKELIKYEFWLGSMLSRQGQTKEAHRKWKRIAENHPLTYYGILARPYLSEAPIAGRAIPSDALSKQLSKDVQTGHILLLFQLGYTQAAQTAAKHKKGGSLKRRIGLSQAVGDYYRGYRQGYRLVPRPAAQTLKGEKGHLQLVPSSGWRASYATPHLPLMTEACRAQDVDLAFAYAIMRTESGFKADAISVAGARGLLQLMPYTARGMAKKLGQPPPSANDLYKPDVVIPLGVAFLKTSENEFGSSLLSAAAYNAGPSQVAQWLQQNGDLPPVLFIERIPYKETRNYVKKILATQGIYRALDGDPLVIPMDSSPIGTAPAHFTSFSSTDNDDKLGN